LLLIIAVIAVGGFFLYGTLTDYKPQAIETITLKGIGKDIDTNFTFSFLSWNIGYAALGKEMDFFYDGGKNVRPPKNNYIKYRNGIKNSLSLYDSIDFILLQEVDANAKRSYYENQVDTFVHCFPEACYAFAKNYDVSYVPFPLNNPMGKVVSGLVSISKYKANEAFRYAFYANFSWPKSLYFLDRCFLLLRYKLANHKDLIVLNTHNSAFDTENKLKPKELELIKTMILSEFQKGNYIIVGGDWNQNPPHFDSLLISCDKCRNVLPVMSEDFLPNGWQWVYNSDLPTNRDVDDCYIKGKTGTSVIDFFLLSPNIRLISNKTLYEGFENSDHHAVYMKIILNQ